MAREENLQSPCLVAAWPGMGAVGISATYYLMAKLGMHLMAEFPAREFFERESVEVKNGLLRLGRLPRSRLFLWRDPAGEQDLIVFIGEAQPPSKGDAFCRKLIEYVRKLGVEQVFTFAAMATQMRPRDESRVFGAAIEEETLGEFERLELEILQEGAISGMNGILLGVAAEFGMRGGCFLGEMPHLFPQFPFPKASLAVLNAFCAMAGCVLDLSELEEQAKSMEVRLDEVLKKVEKSVQSPEAAAPLEFPEPAETDSDDEKGISPSDRQRIEALFQRAEKDRSQAYQLKQELDRLKLFHEYEDRFLDLFREPQ